MVHAARTIRVVLLVYLFAVQVHGRRGRVVEHHLPHALVQMWLVQSPQWSTLA